MKECDIMGEGVKTYSDPPTYFQGGQDPHPMIYAPGGDVGSQRLR